MSIPDEADEEECLASLLNLPNAAAVRTVIYRICAQYPELSLEAFIDRFVDAIQPKADTATANEIAAIWHRSIEAAILTDGAWELLDALRSRGIRLSLVSNTSPASHHIIDRLDLRRRFDVVVLSCDVGYLKPDPRIFRLALQRMGSDPEYTVVIGDKIRTDVLGGAILGLKSILVETRMKKTVEDGRSYVDAIVPSIKDITSTTLFRKMFS